MYIRVYIWCSRRGITSILYPLFSFPYSFLLFCLFIYEKIKKFVYVGI